MPQSCRAAGSSRPSMGSYSATGDPTLGEPDRGSRRPQRRRASKARAGFQPLLRAWSPRRSGKRPALETRRWPHKRRSGGRRRPGSGAAWPPAGRAPGRPRGQWLPSRHSGPRRWSGSGAEPVRRRRFFLFTASAACGFAQDHTQLVLARVAQGVGRRSVDAPSPRRSSPTPGLKRRV